MLSQTHPANVPPPAVVIFGALAVSNRREY